MRTLTQLVGTTANSSPTTYPASFTSLSNNNSAANVALGKQLASDHQRYLIQKYFDNERSATITTVGSSTMTLTATLSAGAVSATLSASWTKQTGTQYVTFSNGGSRDVLFTSGSTTISWTGGLSTAATTTISSSGQQFYPIPANVSKLTNDTINVGQLRYQPVFVHSRQDWDNVNFLPYNSDIPQYCFIYNNQLGIWPIPSTTGNALNFNYKLRAPDLSFSDYSTGTLAAAGMVSGSASVTGLATSWNTTGAFPLNTNILFYNLFLRADPPYGDGIWYQILRFNSDTSLTLVTPVIDAPNITAATTYTIGQLPILSEDFHDMLVYGPLMTYYSTIVKDVDRFKEFSDLYKARLELLSEYAGTKNVDVDLEGEPNPRNPNLFLSYPNT